VSAAAGAACGRNLWPSIWVVSAWAATIKNKKQALAPMLARPRRVIPASVTNGCHCRTAASHDTQTSIDEDSNETRTGTVPAASLFIEVAE
jgi:hypothetical protein